MNSSYTLHRSVPTRKRVIVATLPEHDVSRDFLVFIYSSKSLGLLDEKIKLVYIR